MIWGTMARLKQYAKRRDGRAEEKEKIISAQSLDFIYSNRSECHWSIRLCIQLLAAVIKMIRWSQLKRKSEEAAL